MEQNNKDRASKTSIAIDALRNFTKLESKYQRHTQYIEKLWTQGSRRGSDPKER